MLAVIACHIFPPIGLFLQTETLPLNLHRFYFFGPPEVNKRDVPELKGPQKRPLSFHALRAPARFASALRMSLCRTSRGMEGATTEVKEWTPFLNMVKRVGTSDEILYKPDIAVLFLDKKHHGSAPVEIQEDPGGPVFNLKTGRVLGVITETQHLPNKLMLNPLSGEGNSVQTVIDVKIPGYGIAVGTRNLYQTIEHFTKHGPSDFVPL